MPNLGTVNSTTSIATTAELAATKLDDLAAPDDNTDLNATTGVHGLLPKLGGGSTNFLRADGTWNAPAGGAAGALVLLEQHTASASATLDFTTCISSTYDEYLIELVGIMPATNAVDLRLRMSTDGGANYDASGVYSYDQLAFRAGGVGSAGTSGAAQIVLNFNGGGDTVNNTIAGLPVNGTLRLYSPLDTTQFKTVTGRIVYRAASFRLVCDIRASYESATAVNAIRFVTSSGNIASGVVRVYGIAKS